MSYSRRRWACPFFRWDEMRRVNCEAGKLSFPDGVAKRNYADEFCGSVCGWESCTAARMLVDYYDRTEDDDGKKRGQDQAP